MRRRSTASIARRLGLEPREAALLLEAMGARVGRRGLALRSAAFHVAASRAARRMLPATLRRRALAGLVGPLLETPAALNAYAGDRSWPAGDPCAGLVPDA